MQILRTLLLVLPVLSMVPTALADTLILVPGYLSSPQKWRYSGVTRELVRHNISDAGYMNWGPNGVMMRGYPPRTRHRFFTVNLPSEAPIDFQSRILNAYVQKAKTVYPGEKISIAGFSAGGIVARYMMVRNPGNKIDALITVASPNLGTQTALIGRAIGNSPLSMFTPFFGGNTINRSQRLYHDLSPENPMNLVGWLNRQQHPKARYLSIIHTKNAYNPLASDNVIKGWRQDLNNVVALRGRVHSKVIPATHTLVPADGYFIAQYIKSGN